MSSIESANRAQNQITAALLSRPGHFVHPLKKAFDLALSAPIRYSFKLKKSLYGEYL